MAKIEKNKKGKKMYKYIKTQLDHAVEVDSSIFQRIKLLHNIMGIVGKKKRKMFYKLIEQNIQLTNNFLKIQSKDLEMYDYNVYDRLYNYLTKEDWDWCYSWDSDYYPMMTDNPRIRIIHTIRAIIALINTYPTIVNKKISCRERAYFEDLSVDLPDILSKDSENNAILDKNKNYKKIRERFYKYVDKETEKMLKMEVLGLREQAKEPKESETEETKVINRKNTSILSKIKYLYRAMGILGTDIREKYYKALNKQNVDVPSIMLEITKDIDGNVGNLFGIEDYMSHKYGMVYELMMYNESSIKDYVPVSKYYLSLALDLILWEDTEEGYLFWEKIYDEGKMSRVIRKNDLR